MQKLIAFSALVATITACTPSEPPFTAQRVGNGMIQLVSHTEEITIEGSIGNQGNCKTWIQKLDGTPIYPKTLKYGETGWLHFSGCTVIEAEIETDLGVWTLNF